ncbi:MAG: HsdR family type I site-specific deoxyribonuclease [Muribaculum sp.]|nr:HsdR family type I site-specific deoxyribonuclease [Muribaculum sp.]
MSHQSFNSEAQFEAALIKLLQQYGWEQEVLKNPTEQELIQNWANILFENNRQSVRLGNYPLTETEMQQVIDNINNLRSPLALNEFINGGTTSIRRDNPDDVDNFGKEVTLKIYDRREIAAGDSRYQIVQQPKFPTASPLLNNRRGDLMLLINGMPVMHIELKKSGVDVSQASNQIEKYAKEGIFSRGLFSLVQIFVAMNPEETLYFANPGPEGTFNKNFYFHWADFYNEPINEWEQIVKLLLSIPMAHQLIGFYTVPDSKDGVLKVMRSYQYYAANAISTKVAKTHWEDKSIYGGFIWHTTGSGKTMTSFKSAQLIAQSGDADKVVFLMDRIELGTQSLEEYQGFAGDSDNVEGTENTEALVNKLESNDANMRLIVTSIQKMGLVYDKKRGEEGGFAKQRLDKIRAKRIVFIIDECHRSTFGETLAGIKQNFPGALYFGFTGTPIDDENDVNGMTTKDLFGERLHLYSIADGIRDGNVLGFDPYKVLTLKDKDVRLAVALAEAKAETLEEVFEDEAKKEVYDRIMAMPMVSTERNPDTGAYLPGVEDLLPNSQYRRAEHREKVVEDIIENFPVLSAGGKFHAILATSSIPEAIEYYRLLKAKAPNLKCTAIFDPSIDNNGSDRAMIKEEGLVEILEDYAKHFGIEFTIPTWQFFKKDVAKRMAHKKPYQRIGRDKQLDIMIVVDQMLTGFDSKWVNTMYVDKMLAYEGLIQAFSRTNRLFGHDKRFGIIRYYRRPHRMERNIEDAFALYAHGRPDGIFVSKLGHNIGSMNHHFEEIKYMFERADIENFSQLPTETSVRSRFAREWRNLNAALDAAKMQGFIWSKKRYKWTDEDGKSRVATIAFDEATYLTLAQRYKELHQSSSTGPTGGEEEVPYEIEPYLTEIDTGRIDSAYMNSRFQKYLESFYNDDEKEVIDAIDKELHMSFAHLSAEDQKYANIFLNDIQQGRVNRDDIASDKSLSDYIEDYKAAAKNDQIHRFAETFGVDEDKLRDIIALHLPESNLGQGGHYDELYATLNKGRAGDFLQQLNGGQPVPPFLVAAKADKLLRDFIVRGGFDIDELI